MADSKLIELAKLVATGKATPEQIAELSKIAGENSKEEVKKIKAEKIEKLKAFATELNLTAEDIQSAFAPQPVLMIEWEHEGKTYQHFTGKQGKPPVWVQELKKTVSEQDAYKLAKNDKGRTFIHNLYNPKQK